MSDHTKARAKQLAKSMVTARRRSIPVRAEFVRSASNTSDSAPDTPLRRLVRLGGSDGLLLKLYLALIWRCSAPPFDTQISARQWGELLALPADDKNKVSTRRVAKALRTLESHKLIKIDQVVGDNSKITLLNETGNGSPYTLPYGGSDANAFYLRVPITLWTGGKIHELGTPGLAMLLAILADQPKEGGPVWWSTQRFKRRIGLSPSTRTRGTRELVDAKLLHARRGMRPNDPRAFAKESTVTIYKLQGAAAPAMTRKTAAVLTMPPVPRKKATKSAKT